MRPEEEVPGKQTRDQQVARRAGQRASGRLEIGARLHRGPRRENGGKRLTAIGVRFDQENSLKH